MNKSSVEIFIETQKVPYVYPLAYAVAQVLILLFVPPKIVSRVFCRVAFRHIVIYKKRQAA